MKELTHWKKLDNPDYLGAYAFQPGEEKVVQIKSVGQEDVYNPTSNKKETCTVARFVDSSIKPMILNTTNCKTISTLYNSPYIEEWQGKSIAIYVAKVKAFGDVVEALRIRNKVPCIDVYTCVDCKVQIKPAAGKSAKEIAQIGVNNCGRELCLECMKKEKARMEQEQKVKEESEGENNVSED